jgi:leader peptidase (prepilin peptidase)/N-methyltransferase
MSIWESRGLLIYCGVVALLLGAVFGSFLNCAAWRLSHGESVLRGRSHCTACGHVLGAGDLVPILSWLFLRGRCRYCGKKIPARYPLTEAVFALLTLLCLLRFDLSWLCLRNWILLCCLFCLSLTDLECMIIPDVCLIIAAAVWGIFLPLTGLGWPAVRGGLLAGLIFGGGLLGLSLLMDRILKRDSLGGGDIKLIGVLGLYLGVIGMMFALFAACLLGILYALITRNLKRGQTITFGPFLAVSGFLMAVFGETLVQWYVDLIYRMA